MHPDKNIPTSGSNLLPLPFVLIHLRRLRYTLARLRGSTLRKQ